MRYKRAVMFERRGKVTPQRQSQAICVTHRDDTADRSVSRARLASANAGRRSVLRAVRATAAITYLGGIAVIAFWAEQPLMLAGLLLAVILVAALAGIGRALSKWMHLGIFMALFMALVNALAGDGGLTVLVRGPRLPVFGSLDITAEGIVYGLIVGLRVLVVVLAFGVYAAAVDPDEILRLMRRLSFRSALTASLATRMVPTLARDATRLDDARRCRALRGARSHRERLGALRERAPVARAMLAGALERAVDVAAALEVRGFGRGRPSRRRVAPWSVNDLAFAVSGTLMAGGALALSLSGMGGFRVYPELQPVLGIQAVGLTVAVLVVALAPFGAAAYRRRRLPSSLDGFVAIPSGSPGHPGCDGASQPAAWSERAGNA